MRKYPSTPNTDNLEAVLHLLPSIEKEEALLGEVVVKEGVFPYWTYSDLFENFVQTLYDNGWIIDFNWPQWQEEAKDYIDNIATLKKADLETLQKLITLHVRKNRFCDGHLVSIIKSGHIGDIFHRAKEILQRTIQE
jgi:O-acetyl-ADP-ribose deacetylase